MTTLFSKADERLRTSDREPEAMAHLAAQFHEVFAGNERHHGTHDPIRKRRTERGKVLPEGYRTLPGSATPALWLKHLEGTVPLGVIPIQDDGTCRWGCIDVDEYRATNHKRLAAEIERLGLPLIVCCSKSGGAHLLAFFSEPVPARDARAFLSDLAGLLGFASAEIFPKQNSLDDGDHGSWLNAPYFRAELTTRYATSSDRALEPNEFLEEAHRRQLSPAGFEAWSAREDLSDSQAGTPEQGGAETSIFEDHGEDGGAYSAIMLQRYGAQVANAPEGQRNNALNRATFHLASMVPRGWIGLEEVRRVMLSAAEACGLMHGDERKSTLRTIAGALKRGMQRPHDDLKARATKGRGSPDLLAPLAGEIDGFHTADMVAFVDLLIGTRRETWPVKSKEFRLWLTRRAYERTSKPPSEAALDAAVAAVEAQALFGAPVRDVSLRVAGAEGRIFLDLCNDQWEAVEVTPEGWRVIASPPVRFRRTKGMLPLPTPARGGHLTDLRAFVNVETEEDFVLAASWLLGALSPRGPYPILATSGPEGSAKTSFCKALRALIDPNHVPLRAPPRDNRSLFVGANNNRVLGFDNLSWIPDWMSDTLCRIATGGGHAERTNYTDEDETLFVAERPMILNGIPEVVTRPDLANRTISVTLEPIENDKRRPEQELWQAFEAARPSILGALLNAAVHGLRELPETHLTELPRMADFAHWVTACEVACGWERGTFMRAYMENAEATADLVAEGDEVAQAVVAFMRYQEERCEHGRRVRTWAGTAKQLLALLNQEDVERNSKTWPSGPRALRARLNRAARTLRDRENITIQKSRQAHDGRKFTITAVDMEDGVPF